MADSSFVPKSFEVNDLILLRERKEFLKVFLYNQLCRNIQSALRDLSTRRGLEEAAVGPIPVKNLYRNTAVNDDQISND